MPKGNHRTLRPLLIHSAPSSGETWCLVNLMLGLKTTKPLFRSRNTRNATSCLLHTTIGFVKTGSVAAGFDACVMSWPSGSAILMER